MSASALKKLGPPAQAADQNVFPAAIGLEHLVELGISRNVDAARKMVRSWPAELRIQGVGRRVLFGRDRLMKFLGLDGG